MRPTAYAGSVNPTTSHAMSEPVRIDLYELSGGTLMNEREVAAAIFVSVRTLQDWRRTKQGPDFLKAGNQVRYRARDVIAWLERRNG